MMEGVQREIAYPDEAACDRCRGCSMDTLDSIWFGIKLGVAIIGMVMMRSVWREIWRGKRAVEQKDR